MIEQILTIIRQYFTLNYDRQYWYFQNVVCLMRAFKLFDEDLRTFILYCENFGFI